MDKSEKAREEMVATLLGCIIKTFCGEETADELVEMARLKHKIDKCLAEPTTIPTSLVDRFNELCKKSTSLWKRSRRPSARSGLRTAGSFILMTLESKGG